MKIAISEIEAPAEIVDIDYSTGGAIVGGDTQVSVDIGAFASGDVTFTQTEAGVYTFTYEAEEGTYNISLGFGIGIGASFNAA